jgi:UDP-galactopyranose mutase
MYNYLIVGAGFYGATMARILTDAGKRVCVFEKRDKVGGNASDTWKENFLVQDHGGHIFHTNSKAIWDFVNRFGEFWNYRHEVIVKHFDKVYSFPFSMRTPHEVRGETGKGETQGDDLESWAINQAGKQIYWTFIKYFTEKQWGRSCRDLPASIIKRIPFRDTYYNGYFTDEYQGMPVRGYTKLIKNMLKGIDVELGAEILGHDDPVINNISGGVIYSGPIDEFYHYEFGELEYRSLRWEEHLFDYDSYQGIATVNHTGAMPLYTKTQEWKYFMRDKPRGETLVSFEYPQAWDLGKERYYPIPNDRNRELAKKYKAMAAVDGILTGGRLGSYQYLDMHQAIGQAMKDAKGILDA